MTTGRINQVAMLGRERVTERAEAAHDTNPSPRTSSLARAAASHLSLGTSQQLTAQPDGGLLHYAVCTDCPPSKFWWQ